MSYETICLFCSKRDTQRSHVYVLAARCSDTLISSSRTRHRAITGVSRKMFSERCMPPYRCGDCTELVQTGLTLVCLSDYGLRRALFHLVFHRAVQNLSNL